MPLPLLALLHFHCRHVPLFLISIDFPLSQLSSPQCSSFFLYSHRETGFGASVFQSNRLSITKINPNDRLQPLQALIQPFARLEPLSGGASPMWFIHTWWFIFHAGYLWFDKQLLSVLNEKKAAMMKLQNLKKTTLMLVENSMNLSNLLHSCLGHGVASRARFYHKQFVLPF